MKTQSKKDAKGAGKPSKPAKDKTSTSRKNLDIKEKLAKGFSRHRSSGPGVTLSALGTEPDLPEEVAGESSAPAPEAKRKKPGRRKRGEEKPETPPVQREPIPLKNGPAPEDVNETKEDGQNEAKEDGQNETDELGTPEPQRDFATQRETIEDIDPREIQPFQTIQDYLEPTSSLYPIVVKTPVSTTCLDGWTMVQQALDTERTTLTCHIYHLAEVSVEELAIRKLAIRVVPEGGFDSYAERARNYTKCKELLIATNESLVTFAHGGARRGIEFASATERSVNRLLAERLGKSEETTRKYSLHGEYLNDEAFQELVEEKAGSKFFQDIQKVKSRLVENLKGQRVSHEDIVGRVSQEILRLHRAPEETRNQIIKNLVDTLNRTEPQQNTNAAEPAGSEPEGAIAEGGEPQEREGGQEAEEIEIEEGAEERQEQAPQEEITEPEEPSEPPALATANSESQEQQAFNDVEIRNRGIAICEELKGHLANREITLSEAKEQIRILIQTLDQLLAQIPDA